MLSAHLRIIVIAALLLVGCGRRDTTAGLDASTSDSQVTHEDSSHQMLVSDRATDRPIVSPREGYTGSDACLDCHANEHASWQASYHRTMTQLVSPETVAAKFDGRELNFYGWRFRPEKREELDRPVPEGVLTWMQLGGEHIYLVEMARQGRRKLAALAVKHLRQNHKDHLRCGIHVGPSRSETG